MISVIFATYNGEKTLSTMLDAFCELEIDCNNNLQIIAVDNASTDETASIIKGYIGKLPIIYLYEGKQGKNYALNLGLKYVEGDLIIFTDDDIIPQKNWLIQLNNCSLSYPDYQIFCGPIYPIWPFEPEIYMLNVVPISVAFAVTDVNRDDGEIAASQIFGANMAVRKEVIQDNQLFDVSVGPNGKNYPMGSETEFTKRLENLGYKSWFCSSAKVGHIIRESQLSFDWLFGRAFRYGRGQSIILAEKYDHVQKFLGVPIWMLKVMSMFYLKSYWYRLRNKKYLYLEAGWNASYYKGFVYQLYVSNKK